MQTMKDVAPVNVIRAEFRRLTAPQMMAMVNEIGDYLKKKLIDDRVHDYLLEQLLHVTQEKTVK